MLHEHLNLVKIGNKPKTLNSNPMGSVVRRAECPKTSPGRNLTTGPQKDNESEEETPKREEQS